jgi:hypothetical protein
LVDGCTWGGAFRVVFAVVCFCAAASAVIIVAFRVEFVENARGLFFGVAGKDFVVCYLKGG